MHDDLERAREIFPDAFVIAVNGAASELRAQVLFTFHPEKMSRWSGKQERKFGPGFTTHSNNPGLDYRWKGLGGRGGSAWGARKLAHFLGLGPVVLVGCPLEVGAYTNGSGLGGYMTRQDVVDNLYDTFAGDIEWHENAYSMSGRTRDILGEPT